MRIGAHFGHKAKPLPPANTVLLNLLSAGRQKAAVENESQSSTVWYSAFLCFQLIFQNIFLFLLTPHLRGAEFGEHN